MRERRNIDVKLDINTDKELKNHTYSNDQLQSLIDRGIVALDIMMDSLQDYADPRVANSITGFLNSIALLIEKQIALDERKANVLQIEANVEKIKALTVKINSETLPSNNTSDMKRVIVFAGTVHEIIKQKNQQLALDNKKPEIILG